MGAGQGRVYRLGPLLWAVGLVVIGSVLLLLNFDLLTRFEPVAQFLMAALLGLAAAAFFFSAYRSPAEDWAQLIPAWTLVALAVMALSSVFDGIDQRITAALLFVGLAAAFLHLYLLNRLDNWWAIIPGGFMMVLALVIALSVRVERPETLAALLFAGLGLVFFLIFFAPARHRHWWSLVPGMVLVLFGLFILTLNQERGASWLRWWPILLVLAGIGVAIFASRRGPADRMEIHTAPRVRPAGHATTTPPPRAQLGEYTRPAPGATIEVLPDPDEK